MGLLEGVARTIHVGGNGDMLNDGVVAWGLVCREMKGKDYGSAKSAQRDEIVGYM